MSKDTNCEGCSALRDAMADIQLELAILREQRKLSAKAIGKIIAFGKAATLQNIEHVHQRIQEAVDNDR